MPGVVRQMHEHHLFSHIRWPCCQNQNVSNLFLTKIFSFLDSQLGKPLDGANTQPLDFLKRDFGTSEKGWDQRAEGHGAQSGEQHKMMKVVFEVHAYQVIVSTEQFVEAIEPYNLLIGNILMCTFYRLHHNRRKSHTAQRMAKKQCAASQPGGATHARHSSVQVSRNTLRTLAASIIQCNLPMHVSHYFYQQSQ